MRGNLLVVEGSRCLVGSMDSLLQHHAASGADVTLGMNADGSPTGVYVVKADALNIIEDLGYVDLKEQWLPRLGAEGRSIEVHSSDTTVSHPLRTREEFLDSARILWSSNRGELFSTGPASGLIRGSDAQGLRIICPGALVGPGAQVIDSIVMSGAFLPPDVLVVRSLICPETRIQAGADIADAVHGESACLYDHG
jgi:NDP-sugar pyrophosphorylase family protein